VPAAARLRGTALAGLRMRAAHLAAGRSAPCCFRTVLVFSYACAPFARLQQEN
jgi:hypothetical protein